MKNIILILKVSLVIGSIIFFSCTRYDQAVNPGEKNLEKGSANIIIQIREVGSLSKPIQPNPHEIELQNLYITLSTDGETIKDTLDLSGSGVNTVNKTYNNLTTLTDWTLSAESRDQNGTVIHSGSTVFSVQKGQTVNVSLILDAKYSMLVANFYPIRDSVTTCQLLVDGVSRAKSSFAKQTKLGQTVCLDWDYLTTDTTHTIKMDVYGDMWSVKTLLYTGDTTIAVQPGIDTSYTITLHWVGPDTPPYGQADMTVYLGAVGEVIINGELEHREIPTQGLVAYYPFNRNANDASGNGNNGTVSGAVLTEDRNSNANSAYYFDGVDDIITINDSPSFDFKTTKQFTISIWISVKEGSGDPKIISKWGSADYQDDEWFIGIPKIKGNYKVQTEIVAGKVASTKLITSVKLPLNTWNHVALVWSGNDSSAALYINGARNKLNPTAIKTMQNTTESIRIGRGVFEDELFCGKIDDIRLYKCALSTREIQKLYYE